jgi:hypothetical protein
MTRLGDQDTQLATPRRVPGTITLVIASMGRGGAERAVAKLASGLAEKGEQVDLVLARGGGLNLAQLHPAVRVVHLGAPRLAVALVPLARYLRQNRPAVVFSALDYVNVVTILARALSRVPVPLVVSERNTLSVAVAHTTRRRTRWMPRLIRWTYPHADAVVAVSEGVATDLVNLCGLRADSVHVLNNPTGRAPLAARQDHTDRAGRGAVRPSEGLRHTPRGIRHGSTVPPCSARAAR